MNKTTVLGLDIGGANTKAALIEFKNDEIFKSYSYVEYFPFWEKNINELPIMFNKIVDSLVIKNNFRLENLDCVAVTITAELSDAFQTKKEGIITILDALSQVFDNSKLNIINHDGEFVDLDRGKKENYKIAAANWVSTSLFLGKFIPQCILIDSGSTTIDIIPILNSLPVSKGKDDITRMINHELVYTGGLRATIPSITHFVPFRGHKVRISFEKFALISDVHYILNHITEEEYFNDTADNRSKSLEDCYARLSRIICMDSKTVSKDELNSIANYIYEKQLEIISLEIEQFMKLLIIRHPEFKEDPLFVITGLSAEFLIKKSLISLRYQTIEYYEKITNIPDPISSSALAVAGAYYYWSKNKKLN
jgi:probable H4MPT-linked C1 transfer pathway protein